MLKCDKCHKELAEKDALTTRSPKAKESSVICPACFKAETGVDYDTFRYRRESAKQAFFAVLFCLCATIYAFVEKGIEYGIIGLIVTGLIYYFCPKIK